MMKPTIHKLIGLVAVGAGLLAQTAPRPQLQLLPVQGNVYLLAGAGGNIIVQTGHQGTLVVDTGLADRSDDVLVAIHKLTETDSVHHQYPCSPGSHRWKRRSAQGRHDLHWRQRNG
jgi:hypothetical protein